MSDNKDSNSKLEFRTDKTKLNKKIFLRVKHKRSNSGTLKKPIINPSITSLDSNFELEFHEKKKPGS